MIEEERSALAAVIDPVITCVRFDHPVEMADIQALKAALGDIPGLEIYHCIREVLVVVRRAGQVVVERRLTVNGAPALRIFPP